MSQVGIHNLYFDVKIINFQFRSRTYMWCISYNMSICYEINYMPLNGIGKSISNVRFIRCVDMYYNYLVHPSLV